MKQKFRVPLLLAAIGGLNFFWLMPAVNSAKPARYTRIYEDTRSVATVNHSSDTAGKDTASKHKPKYLEESLPLKEVAKRIRPEHFSRAMHFQEVPLEMDTLDAPNIVYTDSISF